jgi:hypothetical protein
MKGILKFNLFAEMDKYEKLKELKKLFDKNILTETEYSKLKNEILFNNRIGNDLIDWNKQDNKNDSRIYFDSKVKTKSKNSSGTSLILILLLVFTCVFCLKNVDSDNASNQIKTDTTSKSNRSSVDNDSTVCKICGHKYSGDGYDLIDGVWKQNTNIQTELCSPNCGMIEEERLDKKYNVILEKHGYKPVNFNQNSTRIQPNSNGFFTGSDGQLHQSSPCGYCHHTGFVDIGDGIQVCPICDGKGEIIH